MDKALSYLSLAARAGRFAGGLDRTEKSVAGHKARLLLLASDAGGDATRKLGRLAESAGLSVRSVPYTKLEIAAATGRAAPVAAAAVEDAGLAEAFLKALSN